MGVTMRGSGGGVPSRRRQTGIRRRSPRCCGDSYSFFPKMRTFKHTLVETSA